MTPLHLAATYDGKPAVIALLIDRGANIEVMAGGGFTPLHRAASFIENPEVAAILINYGADIEARDNSGGTGANL